MTSFLRIQAAHTMVLIGLYAVQISQNDYIQESLFSNNEPVVY